MCATNRWLAAGVLSGAALRRNQQGFAPPEHQSRRAHQTRQPKGRHRCLGSRTPSTGQEKHHAELAHHRIERPVLERKIAHVGLAPAMAQRCRQGLSRVTVGPTPSGYCALSPRFWARLSNSWSQESVVVPRSIARSGAFHHLPRAHVDIGRADVKPPVAGARETRNRLLRHLGNHGADHHHGCAHVPRGLNHHNGTMLGAASPIVTGPGQRC